jgi:hypothetical protein
MHDWLLTQQDLNRLLLWLDPDPDRAGEHYEKIRRKLILIFASRGEAFPEEMADDCINRVAREIEQHYQGSPEFIFMAWPDSLPWSGSVGSARLRFRPCRNLPLQWKSTWPVLTVAWTAFQTPPAPW